MTEHTYIGVTAYIKNEEGMTEKLGVLADAINALTLSCDIMPVDTDKFKDIIESDAYRFLYRNDSVCFTKAFGMPQNTPVPFRRPLVAPININGDDAIRLYIPTNSAYPDKLHKFIHDALMPVLSMLFGHNLIRVKTQTALNTEDFADVRHEAIFSINAPTT